MANVHRSDLVRKLDEELGNTTEPLPAYTIPKFPPSSKHQDPYIRMDYDGKTIFVSTILADQTKGRELIAVLTAMVPFLPDGAQERTIPTK